MPTRIPFHRIPVIFLATLLAVFVTTCKKETTTTTETTATTSTETATSTAMPSPVASTATTATTATAPTTTEAAATDNCPTTPLDPDHPVICIDNTSTKLSASPDSAAINDVMSTDKKTPVEITWVTKKDVADTDTLQVSFAGKATGCLGVDTASSKGKKPAVKIKTKKVQKAKQCRYTVNLNGFNPLDPDVVVTPCCIKP